MMTDEGEVLSSSNPESSLCPEPPGDHMKTADLLDKSSTHMLTSLAGLEEISRNFWNELSLLNGKNSLVDSSFAEMDEPRAKRRYVRKVHLSSEIEVEEESKKTFVVESSSTLKQLIDDAILEVLQLIFFIQVNELIVIYSDNCLNFSF